MSPFNLRPFDSPFWGQFNSILYSAKQTITAAQIGGKKKGKRNRRQATNKQTK